MTDAAVRPALLVEAENWCTCADNVDEERTAHGSTGSFSRCLYCRLASALEAALEREGRLREALKPFAAYSDALQRNGGLDFDGPVYGVTEGFERTSISAEDFKRARAALGDTP
jgi:hypothetical protein